MSMKTTLHSDAIVAADKIASRNCTAFTLWIKRIDKEEREMNDSAEILHKQVVASFESKSLRNAVVIAKLRRQLAEAKVDIKRLKNPPFYTA